MRLTPSIQRTGVVITLVVFLLLVAWCALFAYSAVPVSATDALTALWAPNEQVIAHVIVRDIRLPRVLDAALVGASLAAAGTLMQGLTRNPLASPSLFGVNAGAALGMALVTTVFATSSSLSSPLAAMIGGLSAWCLVMMLGGAWKMGAERGQLVLAGIAISALCSALTKASVILVEDQAASVMAWLAGSFAHVEWRTWHMSWPPLSLALVLSTLLAPKVNVLAMGDERVKSLGVNLTLLRVLVGLAVLVLVGISVSTVGAIAFVGLIVPHMARLLVGYDHRILLPVVMLLGAILTLGADIISRAVVFPTETPAGAVLALIGAPCFLYLVRKKQ
ncbi:iron chelate uptake ABC transporter family permease subunit [Vibrio fluvialis]|uniref:iron chelate uptake ABC transporter family permease subunit n=1 Tax=Vibrio fluvialis TaxID=676 RepID=UPI000CEB6F57|nr:iron chelate uptake ABC transporter family permease subunit [Vibrio fluvialis]AVH33350.1 iron-dicitrate transporter permease subunit [Vibrio fluvialis]TOY94852.1 iron-dicitrate transporter permease subunit [Vibrio fluvialis]TRN14419.1 iron-dicitrate transporter permease subunit [Vibrio fluvialis]